MAKSMVLDYKHQAINTFMTEYNCGEDSRKYVGSKHSALIDKALYNDDGWHKLQKYVQKGADKNLTKMKSCLPFSLQ